MGYHVKRLGEYRVEPPKNIQNLGQDYTSPYPFSGDGATRPINTVTPSHHQFYAPKSSTKQLNKEFRLSLNSLAPGNGYVTIEGLITIEGLS